MPPSKKNLAVSRGANQTPVVQETAAELDPPLISMVIPVYNEGEAVLDACIREVRRVLEEFGKPWEIIFIDDFSTDQSLDKLLTFLELDLRIKVISHTRNLGAVKAMLSGMRLSRGEVVIPFDPDLQFDPECIPALATKVLDGYDFACGKRVDRNDAIIKRFSSWMGSIVINWTMGIRQQDFGSIKAYSRRIVEGILMLPQDYMSLQAAAFSLSRNFVEIPIKHRPRVIGKSKWTFLMRMEYFMDVFTSYARFPFSGVLLVGAFMVLAGIGAGSAGICYGMITDRPVGVPFWVILLGSLIIFLFGCTFMVLAMVGKFGVRAFRRKFQLGDEVYARVHSPVPKNEPDTLSDPHAETS